MEKRSFNIPLQVGLSLTFPGPVPDSPLLAHLQNSAERIVHCILLQLLKKGAVCMCAVTESCTSQYSGTKKHWAPECERIGLA